MQWGVRQKERPGRGGVRTEKGAREGLIRRFSTALSQRSRSLRVYSRLHTKRYFFSKLDPLKFRCVDTNGSKGEVWQPGKGGGEEAHR